MLFSNTVSIPSDDRIIVHTSQPNLRTGRIKVFYILSLFLYVLVVILRRAIGESAACSCVFVFSLRFFS
jgi:hypothetical protein